MGNKRVLVKRKQENMNRAIAVETEGENNNSLSLKVCASRLDSFARPFASNKISLVR